jgi:hypothetical protein
MVPVTEYLLLVLVPPPPATLYELMEYCCALVAKEISRAKIAALAMQQKRLFVDTSMTGTKIPEMNLNFFAILTTKFIQPL